MMPQLLPAALFGLLALAACQTTKAQSPSYVQYTTEQGLPAMQVYNIEQDRDGFVWFATSGGASRFDGRRFLTYTTEHGLPHNSVWDIKQDRDGVLWMLTANGITCHLQNGKMQAGQTRIFGGKPHNGGDLIIDYHTASTAKGSPMLPNQAQYFKQSVSCSLTEHAHTLWIGTAGAGAFRCQNYKTDSLKVRNFLAGKNITSILKDREGNLWFATLDEGVFLLTSPDVLTFDDDAGLPHNDIYAITPDPADGSLWVGDSKGNLSQIMPDEIRRYQNISSSLNTYNRIHAIYIDPEGDKWVGMDEGLKLLQKNGDLFLTELQPVKSIAPSGNGNVWMGVYQNPIRINPTTGEQNMQIAARNVNALAQDAQGTLWVGTTNGLYQQTADTLLHWSPENALLSKSVNDICVDRNGKVWVATNGFGLAVYDGGTWTGISKENGLCSNICLDLHCDVRNRLWVATNHGINSLQASQLPDGSGLLGELPAHYTHADGLASDHTNKIFVNGDSVWVATIKGLTYFSQKAMQKQRLANYPPPIHISGISIGYRDTLPLARYSLKHYENDIQIDFIGLSYKSGDALHYSYTMTEVDTAWRQTPLNGVRYSALPAGRHEFKVVAIDKNGTESRQAAKVVFQIALPWWKTAWFRLLAAAAATSLLSFVAYWVYRYFKDRAEMESRMIESERMALRTQMNPHFLFNALNSIQYFITTGDKKAANMYLSTFSGLMRKVLRNSQKTYISLEEEVDSLLLYLQIEALRFKDKFSYRLQTDPKLHTHELYLPPMLVQPYIENAIVHGLLPKQANAEENRELLVSFSQPTPDVLLCVVQDNGIGRAEAMERQNHRGAVGKKGIGTVNPQKRLTLLNQLGKQPISIKVIDLKDAATGKASGTKVEIRVPCEMEAEA